MQQAERIKDLEACLMVSRGVVGKQEQRIAELEAEKVDLIASLDAAREERGVLFDDCQKLKEECERLKEECDKAHRMRREWERDFATCARVKDAALRERDEARQQAQKMREALVDLVDEYRDRRSQFGDDIMWEKHEDKGAIARAETLADSKEKAKT